MRDTNSDIIHCELLWSAFTGILLKKKFNKPLVLVDHNVEYLKFKELRKFAYSFPLQTIEKNCCKYADKIVVASEIDRSQIVSLYGVPEEKVHVIRNCTDPEMFKYSEKGRDLVRQKHGISSETIVITFVGKMDYIPNVTAVKHIADIIYPIITKRHPKSKFLIVGGSYKRLLKYKRKNMIFTGYVHNLPDYLSASDIVVVPLDSGSGTRIKTLEAAACSRPIVSTKKGVEGQNFLNNKEIIVTERVNQNFVQGILELIEDKQLRDKLGNNARRKVESQYDWREEIKKFEEVYEEVL